MNNDIEIFDTVVDGNQYVIELKEIAVGYECNAYRDGLCVAWSMALRSDDAVIQVVTNIEEKYSS